MENIMLIEMFKDGDDLHIIRQEFTDTRARQTTLIRAHISQQVPPSSHIVDFVHRFAQHVAQFEIHNVGINELVSAGLGLQSPMD
jgi:hypothetical protein